VRIEAASNAHTFGDLFRSWSRNQKADGSADSGAFEYGRLGGISANRLIPVVGRVSRCLRVRFDNNWFDSTLGQKASQYSPDRTISHDYRSIFRRLASSSRLR